MCTDDLGAELVRGHGSVTRVQGIRVLGERVLGRCRRVELRAGCIDSERRTNRQPRSMDAQEASVRKTGVERTASL